MRRGSIPMVVVALSLYVFLYLPLVVIVSESFNASHYGTQWSSFTVRWYASVWAHPQIVPALKNTLILGIASTAIATLLGTLLGYGLVRHGFRGKHLISRLVWVPIAVPDIVLAVTLLLFFAMARRWSGVFELGLGTMIIGHVTFQIPFVALVVRSRMAGFDRALEEAAADLGATPWQRVCHVTLPMLRPGILAGALLAFALSLDDFIVSFFTNGPGSTTLPIYIYSAVKRGVTGEIHAVSSLLIAVAVVGTIFVTWWQARTKNKLQLENSD